MPWKFPPFPGPHRAPAIRKKAKKNFPLAPSPGQGDNGKLIFCCSFGAFFLKTLNPEQLDALTQQAVLSPRLRANLNVHPTLTDPIQRLAIAMEPGTYVRPHRHPHTWELLLPLRGRFLVLHFDPQGIVQRRTVLGTDCALVENEAGAWHAVIALDPGCIIFEVKHGPYRPLTEEDYAPWSPAAEAAPEARAAIQAWYGEAALGDRYPGA